MLRRKDDETLKREVGLWLKKNKISFRRYRNLSAYLKGVLRNLVCIPTRPTTAKERLNLWMELCSPARDINGFVPSDEELRKIFTPVAPREKLPPLYRY